MVFFLSNNNLYQNLFDQTGNKAVATFLLDKSRTLLVLFHFSSVEKNTVMEDHQYNIVIGRADVNSCKICYNDIKGRGGGEQL